MEQPNFYVKYAKTWDLNHLYNPWLVKEFCERSAITTDDTRCDISAKGFWSAGQVSFLDVRVFNTNTNRYMNQSLKEIYEISKKEKKRA